MIHVNGIMVLSLIFVVVGHFYLCFYARDDPEAQGVRCPYE